MSDDWIQKRVDAALAANKLVNEQVGDELKQLLKGKLSESELRPKELAEVSNSILTIIASTSFTEKVEE